MHMFSRNLKQLKVIDMFNEGIPDKEKYFHFYHWYILIKQFAPSAIDKWIKNDFILESDKLIA